MADSILESIRERMNLATDDASFDHDLIPAINTALFSLYITSGYGGTAAHVIQDSGDLWSEIMTGITNAQAIKSYVFLKTRIEFDPPQNSYLITAIEKQIATLEFQLQAEHDFQ